MRGGPVNRQGPAFRPKKDLTDADLTAIASAAGSDSVMSGEGGGIDHRMLKAFLAYNSTARFTSPADMHGFLSALLASSRTSAVWTAHDASDILAEIGPAKPGVARLAEIVNKPFSTMARAWPHKLPFQRGFLVFAMYLTSDIVNNSHLVMNVNAMYAVLHANLAWVPATIECIKDLMARKKVAEAGARDSCANFEPDNFLQVFLPLAHLLHEYLSRFNDAVIKCPQTEELISTLIDCFNQYSDNLLSAKPIFVDPLSKQDVSRRRFALENVKRYLDLLPRIAERTQARPFPQAAVSTSLGQTLPPGVLSMLFEYMQMPGELRPEGPRHDNDFSDFRDIAILPTHAELTSTAPPFVPANLPEAPHHLEGMERQLDILLRLMREDFVGPLRSAVQSLVVDLAQLGDAKNALARLLKAGGGRYRPDSAKTGDSSDLIIYRDVEFTGLSIDRHELGLELQLRLPWGWKDSNMVIRHLSAGNLVGLVTFDPVSPTGRGGRARADIRISLGVVADDLQGSKIRVSFLETTQRDQTIYLDALYQLARDEKVRLAGVPPQTPNMLLFELPGFLLSTVEPFLLALKHLSSSSIPFAEILSAKAPANGETINVQPPLYARNPGFTFDLSCLLEDGATPGTLIMRATDAQSVANAKDVLAQPGASKLDATQAQAMVDCLCREVALVEGPPGTGKSWLGIELVRVLLQASIGRILVLAFTNHALDEMLKHLIEKSVTTNIVRCGSRSQEEELQEVACSFSRVSLSRF
ncbi:P-loop containing nucleoside triphosphate hydrolase protein [Rhodotorula toruloides]|uniref:P-loop containing nucleoside triphosphate hydrolase protein n=1 Tax=Rhodotorula toruloides TaxID=5286 RepID=A0A511KR33_RHOTO|nr:P-loop containing nucleoside triphosphate hydrolase protein [Rhodotorula toruloides]